MYLQLGGPRLFSLRLLGLCWHKGLSWRAGSCSWEGHRQQHCITLTASVKLGASNFPLRNCLEVRFVFTYLFSFLAYCFRCKPELRQAGVGFNSKFCVTPLENHFLSKLHPALATCSALPSG